MRIEIRNGKEMFIITFHTNTDRFRSDYERIQFFRKLHGWNQTVPRNGKKYEYRREGLLDRVPHEKIADSVFLLAKEHMKMMETFFHEWEDKVDYEIMEIMLKNNIRHSAGSKYINKGGEL